MPEIVEPQTRPARTAHGAAPRLPQSVVERRREIGEDAVESVDGDGAPALLREDGSRPVPMRLRNAPTRLMKDLGYGKGYRYAHDEPDAYAAGEHYLPDDMPEVRFYEPTERGFEQRIGERLAHLAARSRKAGSQDP